MRAHAARARGCTSISGTTSLCIAPGYTLRVVDGLLTNFHAPDSTLMLLVSAVLGSTARLHAAYAHAAVVQKQTRAQPAGGARHRPLAQLRCSINIPHNSEWNGIRLAMKTIEEAERRKSNASMTSPVGDSEEAEEEVEEDEKEEEKDSEEKEEEEVVVEETDEKSAE